MSIDRSSTATSRTLAFLFTDVEGSTRLWERYPEGMRTSLAQHDRLLHGAVEDAGGRVVKTMGDGVMAVFGTARDALRACLGAQLALQREPWGETGPLRVRMGLHVGEAQEEGHDFHGQAVNRAARIMAAGHGGQVLVSGATAALVVDQLPSGTSLRDLGEHHLKDLSRAERVFQVVHADLPDTFPPLSTVDERLRSLPTEPSPFIGREAERARVAEHLGDDAVRLLTLTGPGGIGKTRLALRAARDVEERFTAGAAFVDLSAARDTTSMLTTIARELGFADASEGSQLDELTAHIGRQRLLAILDNFEQVTATAPTLSQLLQDCPELKLMVTSREALHVRGERLFPVPPMALPDALSRAITAEQVEGYEAVRLFVERARAVKPGFTVTDENAAILADICRRLEGLPLAIELATARLRVFSLEALRDRLGSSLRVLGSGARDLPERQQTLRATIEWSYQLLAPEEQRLFEVMSCFHGADVEAVESVAGELATWLTRIDPIDGLISLADKSLIRQSEAEGREPRFEMLESIREYASERLVADPDLARRARAAHATYYAGWVERIGPELDGPARAGALELLADELENLRAAWRQCVDDRDLERLQTFMAGLWPLHDARGWYRGLTDLAADVLNVLGSLPASPEHEILAVTLRSSQARALTAMEGYTAEVEAAYERLHRSLEGAAVPQVYPVLRTLASLYGFRAEHVKAAEIGRQILRLPEAQGDPAIRVAGHLALGTGLSFGGRIEDGIPELEAGVRWFEAHPYGGAPFRLGPDPRVSSLTALSLLLWWQGSLDQSAERSRQSLALARELAHPSTTGYALFHAALLAHWRGEPEAAREIAVRVIEVAEEHDLLIWRAVGQVVLGASAVALGGGDEGLRWISEGLQRYRGLRTPPIFWPFLLSVQAGACARAGRYEAGLGLIDEALALAPLPDLHTLRGDLLLASGAGPGAEAAWETALEASRAWGASTTELRAAIRLCRAGASAMPSVRGSRLAALRSVVESLTEGLGSPDLLEARDLLGLEG